MLAWLKHHRRKVTTFVVVAVPLWLIVSSAGAEIGASSSMPTQWAGGVVGGAQFVVSSTIGTVGGFWTRLVGGGDVAEENEELHREVARLREENTRLIGVLQENARLREMVEFQTARPDFELAPARVISRDVSPYFRVVKVRIESDHDLAPRMPVVAPDGVVGQIHKVYGRYADVVLVADPRSRIDAISQRNRALGVVQGLGTEADYRASVAYLTDRDEIQLGDRMVTSGMGEIFPRELEIGTVVEIDDSMTGLFQEVVVEPSVDFSRLEEVFVITDVD